MHIESSSSRVENDSARLYSPVFKVPVNESACFVFWYHMFGNTTGNGNINSNNNQCKCNVNTSIIITVHSVD